ncbi:MAG: hypothetical protein IPN34_21400 [Planctomycetes bacterium]|nr:hypothetical protein [Planctomycetota bacterium]
MTKKAKLEGKKADSGSGEADKANKRRRGKRRDSLAERLVKATEFARNIAVHTHQVQREVARLPTPVSEESSPESAAPSATQAELLESPLPPPEREYRCYPMPDELLVFIQPLRANIRSLSEEFNSELLWLLAGLLYPSGFRIGRYRAASAHEFAWRLGSMELEWMLRELEEMGSDYVPPVVRDGRELITDEDREAWLAECEADNEGRWTEGQWSDYQRVVRELHEAIRDFDYRRLLIALDCEHGAGRRALGFAATAPKKALAPQSAPAIDSIDADDVLRAFREGGCTTLTAAAEHIRRSYSYVQRIAAGLVAEGRLIQRGKTRSARYSVPPPRRRKLPGR